MNHFHITEEYRTRDRIGNNMFTRLQMIQMKSIGIKRKLFENYSAESDIVWGYTSFNTKSRCFNYLDCASDHSFCT
jgi:hypothetical protein